jgi:hypothetical protein
MASKLVVAVIVVAPDCRLFQGPAHSLGLAVRPGDYEAGKIDEKEFARRGCPYRLAVASIAGMA